MSTNFSLLYSMFGLAGTGGLGGPSCPEPASASNKPAGLIFHKIPIWVFGARFFSYTSSSASRRRMCRGSRFPARSTPTSTRRLWTPTPAGSSGTAYFTLDSGHCIVPTAHCTMHTALWCANCTLLSAHSTLHITLCTFLAAHYTLHAALSTVHTHCRPNMQIVLI